MSRRIGNLVPPPPPGKAVLLRPLAARRNLTGEVVARIAQEIRSGALEPGTRLPTEQVLMTAMGVSRTVIREAIAALRADGLVTTRQGSGAYVASDSSRIPFRIDPDGLSSIKDVLEVMELRLAIEVEAAALAAARITPQRLARVHRALGAIETAIERGGAAILEDFTFHRAIAEASGNPRFAELLEYLGRHVIPRQSIRVSVTTSEEHRNYLIGIQQEHHRIYDAVRDRDPVRSRKSMRAHLTRSLNRYRRLAERQLHVAAV